MAFELLRAKFADLIEDNAWRQERLSVISACPLTPQEAIGTPERLDFPILKGKEVMMQAMFKGAAGQAFSDMPGNYEGTLENLLSLPLTNNFQRAVFVAGLNAVMRYLGIIGKTVHCRDREPRECALNLISYVRELFGNPRIAFIGLQPAMVSELASHFSIRVTDLDPDNIGQVKAGVLIEDAGKTEEVVSWGDIVLATGSTVVNDTLKGIPGGKRLVLYGGDRCRGRLSFRLRKVLS